MSLKITDVLARMMRVPKRIERNNVCFEINTFLNRNNSERIRATKEVMRRVPKHVQPHLGYMATDFDPESNEWYHAFIVHHAEALGVEEQFYETPCLIPERTFPLILIDASYEDPRNKWFYSQHATLHHRRRSIALYPITVFKHETGKHERADESVRMMP